MGLKILTRALSTISRTDKLRDITIIGGGPAGLSLLAALKNSPVTRNLKCTLIEGSDISGIRDFNINPPVEYTNRVVSLTPKSVNFMEEKIGNWEYVNKDRVKFYDNIVAYDSNDEDSRIHFDSNSVGNDALAVMIENLNIQSSLLEKIDILNSENDEPAEILDKTKVVDICNPVPPQLDEHELHEINPVAGIAQLDWPILKLSDGNSIQTRLLVGADGYNSPVRQYAGIVSRGWQYDRFGVVATIGREYQDFRDIAWQRFLTTGPLAILPLTEENATIVWSSTPGLSDVLLKTHEDIFPKLINAAMVLDEVNLNYIYSKLKADPNDMSVIDDIEWRLSRMDPLVLDESYPIPVTRVVPGSRAKFPLKMSHADTYIGHRLALIGDAAHTTHPLAGQGLNMGQVDTASLVAAIEQGVKRGIDIGSSLVLENYVANSWPSNHALLGICDKLHKVFSTNTQPLALFRGLGMKYINSFPPIKDLMVKAISGL